MIAVMKIIILNGVEERLYTLVAPLVMSPSVLRQNRGAAFKTSFKHTWVVAVEENGECIGFLPCLPKKGVVEINNYHVNNRDKEVFKIMLNAALNNFKGSPIEVITQRIDESALKECGFKPVLEWVNYVRYFKANK